MEKIRNEFMKLEFKIL